MSMSMNMNMSRSMNAQGSSSPLDTPYDAASGGHRPRPSDVAASWSSFRLPCGGRSHDMGTFVTTLDGVVTLNELGWFQ